MSIRTYAVLLLAVFIFPAYSLAGGFCCQLRTGVQETLGAATTGPGGVQFGLDYTYSRMQRFHEGSSDVSFSSVMDDPRYMKAMGVVPEDMDMRRITLSASYAATEKLRLVVSVPWVINDMKMQMFKMGSWRLMEMDRVSGLGDVTVHGLYRVYSDRETMPQSALSVGVGLKLPTGSSSVSQDGKRVHAHMQPGTGSWDPMLTAIYVNMLSSKLLFKADAAYQFTTENSLGYEFGDTLSVNARLDYNLLDFLNASAGTEYFHSDQADDRENNYKGNISSRLADYVGNTGEDSVWVKAGLQLLPFDGASVNLDFSYPVFYHVGGIQQTTDYRVSLGASYGF